MTETPFSMEKISTGNHESSVEVRRSLVHGNGLFALRAISAETTIMEYVGECLSKAESLRRCEHGNPYIFNIDETHDLDGNVLWNAARFVNHSCDANCDAIEDGGRMWIVNCRDIAAGEELTYNYNYDLVDYREHPCRCDAPECVGYIVAEEFFEHVRKQNALREHYRA